MEKRNLYYQMEKTPLSESKRQKRGPERNRRQRAIHRKRKPDPLLFMGHALIWGAQIAVVCLLAFVCVWFFGQRVSTAGESMSPVLKNGDIVLTDRLSYQIFSPKRGDIITFHPGGNENTHYVIKRIVALPGETVQIVDGNIYIDGEKQKKDIYVSGIEKAGLAQEPVTLAEDEYFVMGDNHTGSIDSRSADMGNVKKEDIHGKVWFIAGGGRTFGFVKNQED